MGKDFVEVVARRAVKGAGLDPVVAFVAKDALGVLVAEDEVVAGRRQRLPSPCRCRGREVLAIIAHNQVEARAGVHDVVTRARLDIVVATGVGDDVVAIAAIDDVVAETTFELVVAAIAEERIVAHTSNNNVCARYHQGPHGRRQYSAGSWSQGRCARIIADNERREDAFTNRIVLSSVAIAIEIVELL